MPRVTYLAVLLLFTLCTGTCEAQFLSTLFSGNPEDGGTFLDVLEEARFNISNPFSGARGSLDTVLQETIEGLGEIRHVYEAQFKLLKEGKVTKNRLLVRLKDSPSDEEEKEGGFFDSLAELVSAAANLTGIEKAQMYATKFEAWTELGKRGLQAGKRFLTKHDLKGLKQIFYGVQSSVSIFEVEDGFNVEDLWNELLKLTDVEFAELDLSVDLLQSGDQNCPLRDDWGFHHANGASAINLLGAHPEAGGVADVMVVVIDSGLDVDHPSFQGRIWVNEAERDGEPGVDDDGNGLVDDINGWSFADDSNDVRDTNGHGTHVSGIIGASPTSDPDFQGLAPNARILPCKFTSSVAQGSIADAVQCLDYATMMGADIISNSWGGTGAYSLALKSVLDNAQQNGILVVAAAGNSGIDNDPSVQVATFPASYNNPNIISVAAVDDQGRLSTISNFGKESVDIGAPGVDIRSTFTNGGFGVLSGTSMAAPFVTGAAALLMGGCRTQGKICTALDIKNALLSSTQKTGHLDDLVSGDGHLDTERAAQILGLQEANIELQSSAETGVLLRECSGCHSTRPSLAILGLTMFIGIFRWM